VSEDRQPDRIAREIRDDILGGRFRPGERLPSERELARRMGVHRGSAREALRILAQQRLIDVGPGGSRVIPLHRARLDVLGDLLHGSRGPDPTLMAQLLDVHELLVVGAARLAVERAPDGAPRLCLTDLAVRSGVRGPAGRRYRATLYRGRDLAPEPRPVRAEGERLCVALPGGPRGGRADYLIVDVIASTRGAETTAPARLHLYATGERPTLVGLERPSSPDPPRP